MTDDSAQASRERPPLGRGQALCPNGSLGLLLDRAGRQWPRSLVGDPTRTLRTVKRGRIGWRGQRAKAPQRDLPTQQTEVLTREGLPGEGLRGHVRRGRAEAAG
eukprot:7173926-Prymnesium_polylepis.3